MKKNYIFSLILISILFVFASCGDDSEADKQAAEATEEATEASEPEDIEPQVMEVEDQVAICLWGEGGLRSKPGRGSDAKWVSGMGLGDIVILTGNEEMSTDGGRERKYLEMELSDGKVGWSYEYLFAVNAERGVVKSDIDIYKKPELTSFDSEKFNRGEVVAYIKGDKEGWFEVFGKEKKKMGWVRSVDAISTDEIDVTVGILADKAASEKSAAKRDEMLKSIAANNTFNKSELIDIIQDQLKEEEEKAAEIASLGANQLSITGDVLNVRSAPDTEADNVVFQLNSGNICDILEVGDMAEIRDMKDYWYKISFDGKEGWVYGAFTSKKQ